MNEVIVILLSFFGGVFLPLFIIGLFWLYDKYNERKRQKIDLTSRPTLSSYSVGDNPTIFQVCWNQLGELQSPLGELQSLFNKSVFIPIHYQREFTNHQDALDCFDEAVKIVEEYKKSLQPKKVIKNQDIDV